MQFTTLEVTLSLLIFILIMGMIYLSVDLRWTQRYKGLTEEEKVAKEERQFELIKRATKQAVVEYATEQSAPAKPGKGKG